MLGALNFGTARFDLFFVFVANVDESLSRFGNKSCEDNCLNDQMRSAKKKFAILECAGLTFVGICDDERMIVLLTATKITHGVAHIAPFLYGRNSRPAQATEVGIAELV